MFKRLFVFFLAFSVATASFGQALPAGNAAVVGSALVNIIKTKGAQRGFAANDPRWAATTDAVGVVAGTIASVATGAVLVGTAPAWGSVLLTSVLTLAVGAAVTWGVTAASQWLFGTGGNVETTVPAATTPAVTPVSAGATVYAAAQPPSGTPVDTWGTPTVWASTGQAAAWAETKRKLTVLGATDASAPQWSPNNLPTGVAGVMGIAYVTSGTMATGGEWQVMYTSSYDATLQNQCAAGFGQGADCGSVYRPGYAGGPFSDLAMPYAGLTQSSTSTSTPGQQMQAFSEAALAEPANPQLLADMANHLWQQSAAQPGYTGVPFSMDSPITPSDVTAWQAANPSAYPAVKDLVAPATSTTLIPAPQTQPGTGTSTVINNYNTTNNTTNNQTTNNNQIDLGPNPGVAFEDPVAPTAQSILNPLFNMLPGFRDFHAPTRPGVQCPTFELVLWDRTFLVGQEECQLLNSVKPQLQAVASVVWAIAAVVIVLGA